VLHCFHEHLGTRTNDLDHPISYQCKKHRHALFVDSVDSIVEMTTVMMRNATEEKEGLKRCFGPFLSFLI
jgi:hypothetical protein